MFRLYFSYEVGDKRQQKCLPWTLPPGIHVRLIFNYGHWKYAHPLVQVQLDGVLIELTGMADPAPVVQTFIVDPEVGRRWQKDGEFMVGIWLNLTKCPLNIYIYRYIHTKYWLWFWRNAEIWYYITYGEWCMVDLIYHHLLPHLIVFINEKHSVKWWYMII